MKRAHKETPALHFNPPPKVTEHLSVPQFWSNSVHLYVRCVCAPSGYWFMQHVARRTLSLPFTQNAVNTSNLAKMTTKLSFLHLNRMKCLISLLHPTAVGFLQIERCTFCSHMTLIGGRRAEGREAQEGDSKVQRDEIWARGWKGSKLADLCVGFGFKASVHRNPTSKQQHRQPHAYNMQMSIYILHVFFICISNVHICIPNTISSSKYTQTRANRELLTRMRLTRIGGADHDYWSQQMNIVTHSLSLSLSLPCSLSNGRSLQWCVNTRVRFMQRRS